MEVLNSHKFYESWLSGSRAEESLESSFNLTWLQKVYMGKIVLNDEKAATGISILWYTKELISSSWFLSHGDCLLPNEVLLWLMIPQQFQHL